MSVGRILSIYTTEKSGDPLKSITEVQVVPGKGIVGDRKFKEKASPEKEISLIEIEAIHAVKKEYDIELSPAETRRNLITEGVALNHLVDQEFKVGEVTLKGMMLCEPCGHLEELTRAGVRKALIHRGGLRAKILTAGTIHANDTVVLKKE